MMRGVIIKVTLNPFTREIVHCENCLAVKDDDDAKSWYEIKRMVQ